MFIALSVLSLAFAGPDEEEPPAPTVEFDFAAESLGAPMRMKATYGATPGGAQDVAYFRDRVAAGEVPLPETFTSEGLLSEHDLPLASAACSDMLCTNAKAIEARLPQQPEVTHLLQLGFSSGLTAETFRRDPLHLVAVIDQSCSMSGAPLDTVRRSLDELVRTHLGPDDQLSVVLYGTGTTIWIEPTPVRDREALAARIAAIPSDRSTNMEAGMRVGFDLARAHQRAFDGSTRLMLFTDERPNTGNTEAEGFMALARAGSADGIGMTTIGVSTQFGAELAADISAVRGGNLFYFPDTEAMVTTFRDDFDTMVTELAYDLAVDVAPARGLRIAGVYGVPGDLVEWDGDHLRLTVETLFLSKSKGGIYLALAEEDGQRHRDAHVADVALSYDAKGGVVNQAQSVASVKPGPGDEGLTRGLALVDMATTLTKAAGLHHRHNDQEGAWQAVRGLQGRLAPLAVADADLATERTLVDQLEETLARLAGRQGERPVAHARDEVTGLPR